LPRKGLIPAFPVFDGAALERLREVGKVRCLLSGLKRVLANAAEWSLRCKDEHVSIDGALECISASGRNLASRDTVARKNISEKSGISIPECQSCYRRQRDGVPAVRSPEPLGRRDLHSVSAIRPWLRRFSILVVGDREGVIAFSDTALGRWSIPAPALKERVPTDQPVSL
jgi:hypothetical protein